MRETLERIPCNICEGMSCAPYLTLDGFAYQKCIECGLVYQNPRPVFEDLRKRYGGNYFEYEITNQENFFHLMELGLRDIRFDTLFEGREGESSFLDIGCATGLLLNYIQKMGWNTKGVEICRESAEYAIREFGVDVFVGSLHEAQFPDQCFDVIHFSHLIEHVPDPKGLLIEVKRILKPGGHVILTTPNADGFQSRLAGKSWRSAISDHLYLFTKKSMHLLLSQTGYRIVRQLSWGGIPLGKRPRLLKPTVDRLAKFFNVGDVMLFHCTKA